MKRGRAPHSSLMKIKMFPSLQVFVALAVATWFGACAGGSTSDEATAADPLVSVAAEFEEVEDPEDPPPPPGEFEEPSEEYSSGKCWNNSSCRSSDTSTSDSCRSCLNGASGTKSWKSDSNVTCITNQSRCP
jgi:hypothetical protein